MFNLDISDSYWWPVKFHAPREDGSGIEVFTFQGKFRRMPVADVEALQTRIVEERLADSEIAKGMLVDWREVANRDGGEVPFSQAAYERALQISGFGTGVVQAWAESLAKGPEKNS